MNLLDDKSDYAKILRYAEYLKKVNKVDDGQMVFASLYGYEEDEIEQREKEIREIINRIIDKNDMGAIQDFADYRNYMSYEIVINNADVKDGKLSRQAGYSSGAGTQIPYTLILSAALSMLYNARVNSTRLIFIDEPFEKMSDHAGILPESGLPGDFLRAAQQDGFHRVRLRYGDPRAEGQER